MTTDPPSNPPIPCFDQSLDGPGAAQSSRVSLRAGPLELLFERETGWIRQVRMGKREVIRAIYGAVRDRNWATVSPVIGDLSIQQHKEHGFDIRFIADCRRGDIHFAWQGLITGNDRGEIHFEFDGVARTGFLRNRIGLCVLLPIAGCAGEPCGVEHSDGTQEMSVFPKCISPFQPLLDIRMIRQKLDHASTLEVHLNGDMFEMEDQRNWTDASFKIYGTPLERPFPVWVNPGGTVRHLATLKWIHEGPVDSTKSPLTEGRSTPDDIVSVEADFAKLRCKTPLGLGLADDFQPLDRTVKRRLRGLHLDHLRVDCRLWEQDWSKRLQQAGEQAEALSAGLHVALFLTERGEAELRNVGQALVTLRAPVRLWLIFHRDETSTRPCWMKLAREVLTPFTPDAKFAGGTDAYFAELNRERPPSDSNWLPCCSINPQVHSSDDLSLVENLAAQTDVVKGACSFSGQPLVISPITLLPRGNPNATEETLPRSAPPSDPRQSSLFAAGWTLGSLHALTSTHPVHSLTYYETVGPRGVMATDDSATVFPIYHVLAGIAELTRLAEVQFPDPRTPLQIAALAGVTDAGLSVLWLSNHTAQPVTVRIKTTSRFRSIRIQQLDEPNVKAAMHHPETGWPKAQAFSCADSMPLVTLQRYGLARVEMQ